MEMVYQFPRRMISRHYCVDIFRDFSFSLLFCRKHIQIFDEKRKDISQLQCLDATKSRKWKPQKIEFQLSFSAWNEIPMKTDIRGNYKRKRRRRERERDWSDPSSCTKKREPQKPFQLRKKQKDEEWEGFFTKFPEFEWIRKAPLWVCMRVYVEPIGWFYV